MQITTGVDMTELRRVRKILRNARFLTRFFGPQEQQQYYDRGQSYTYIAGSFCAKEAFSKALGTGLRGFALRDVQVLRDELGAPYYHLTGAVKEHTQGMRFSLSITHTKDYAVAFTVIWKEDGLQPEAPAEK